MQLERKENREGNREMGKTDRTIKREERFLCFKSSKQIFYPVQIPSKSVLYLFPKTLLTSATV